MPFNGNTFTRLQSWVANAALGLKIRADLMDEDTNDIAAGLTSVATSINTLLSGLASSTGATLVSFLQTGTGGAQQTVQAKLTQIKNFRDFGCAIDGVTDDGVNANLALAACAGQLIELDGPLKSSIPLVVPSGTIVQWRGSLAKVKYTGTTAGTGAIAIYSSKYTKLKQMNVDLTAAGNGTLAVDLQGAWFTKFEDPVVTGSGAANGQIPINLVSSQIGHLAFGCYETEITNPNFLACEYGIKASKQTGDSVAITALSIIKGWGNGCTYPIYLSNVNSFNIEDFSPEGAVDGVTLLSCASGWIRLGEVDVSGWGLNPDANCLNITWVEPSRAGTTSVANMINTANFTPAQITASGLRLYGSDTATPDSLYYIDYRSLVNYTISMQENVSGGSTAHVLRQYGDVLGHQLLSVGGISSTQVQANNLWGHISAMAGTSQAVVFANHEPDANYQIIVSPLGNDTVWADPTTYTTTGFTIKANTSGTAVNWLLVR